MSTADTTPPTEESSTDHPTPPAQSSGAPAARPRPRRRHVTLWVAVVVVVVASVGAYGAYHYLSAPKGCSTNSHCLVVWTYSSFFGSGAYPNASRVALIDNFQNATGSTVQLTYVSTGDLVSDLKLAKPGTMPDVIVGLDELTAPQADASGFLIPYSSPALTGVPSSLVGQIAPDHTVTPYEWGYLGVDYNVSFDAANGNGLSQGDFFQNVAGSPTLSKQFLFSDPLLGDITGEEFLAWEVEYYQNILHQNWTTFFSAVAPYVHPATDWSTGFSEFSAGQYASFVSYTTDEAYNIYFGYGTWMNSTVAQHAGANYGWKTIYGAGLVKGTHVQSLGEKFIDYLLSPTIQSQIPVNEWEYPAVASTTLPSAYDWSFPPSQISALNDDTTPIQSSYQLGYWTSELQNIIA
ncbi:MAG: substrate-binding domain-containing protein [Euryarchaeota archaeon]|nr:substrate-binding domain-containing protein [Euryarchaeota archaeon]